MVEAQAMQRNKQPLPVVPSRFGMRPLHSCQRPHSAPARTCLDVCVGLRGVWCVVCGVWCVVCGVWWWCGGGGGVAVVCGGCCVGGVVWCGGVVCGVRWQAYCCHRTCGV